MTASKTTLSLIVCGLLPCGLLSACTTVHADANHMAHRTEYRAPRATTPPVVDGVANDTVWNDATWRALDQRWLGPALTANDFNGRYKVSWTPQRLYILAEITDDVLYDGHRDPLVQYWDDDCLEVFLDEDFSGGDHQFNHNAFAYHFSLDNQAIDIDPTEKPRNYTHHVESRWQQKGDKIIWEVAIEIYSDKFVDGGDNTPVTLTPEKIMGLMVAYCDNDGSDIRENFMGSEPIAGDGKDRGWIDAGLFGKLILGDSG